MPNTTKKGVLLPVIVDRKYARSDDECSVESLEISDHAIEESVRADRSDGYHASPVFIEKSKVADTLIFVLGDMSGILLASLFVILFGVAPGDSTALPNWMMLIVPIWLATATANGLYPGWGMSAVDELRRTFVVSTVSYLSVALFVAFGNMENRPTLLAVGLSYLLALILVPAIRSHVAKKLTHSGRGGQTTVIYGAAESGRRVLQSIRSDYRAGLIPIAFLDDDPGNWGQKVDGIPVLGDTNLVIPEATTAIVALPRSSTENMASLLRGPLSYYHRIIAIPEWETFDVTDIHGFDGGRFFGLNLAKSPKHPDRRLSKRIFDIVVTLCSAPIWFPLGCIVALAVWFETRSNPIQACTLPFGNHRSNEIYRFTRPLKLHAFLDRTGLRNLPAFVNVLRGTLTIVGPQPWGSSFGSSAEQGNVFGRHIRPGMTGLTHQPVSVSPNGDTCQRTDDEQSDRYYVQRWSVWLDALILTSALKEIFMTWIGQR